MSSMTSRPALRTHDAPPSYEDALVLGILNRTGTTPMPEAPRLGLRGLSTSALDDEPDALKLFKSLHRKPAPPSNPSSSSASSSKPSKPSSSKSSGWQSDTSHVRSFKPSAHPVKKKAVVFEAIPEATPTKPTKEHRIVPLLAYHPRAPLLLLDYSLPASHIRIAGGNIPHPVTYTELDAPAISTTLTSMSITISSLSTWTVHIKAKPFITNRHILDKLRGVLYTTISRTEWDKIRQPYRDRVKLAFEKRCKNSELLEVAEMRNGLRRVDLLCESVIWKGLSPHPVDEDTWVLTLGSL